MAKTDKQTPAADATEPKPAFAAALEAAGLTPTVDAPAATCVAQGPTPENTPIPGGGRYRWDISLPGWIDLDKIADEPAV